MWAVLVTSTTVQQWNLFSLRSHLVTKGSLPPPSVWSDSWLAMRSVMRVQTFQIIVLQGIVGSLPWTAIVFFTMWFELIGNEQVGNVFTRSELISKDLGLYLKVPYIVVTYTLYNKTLSSLGFDHKSSAALNSLFAIGCATGSLLGGIIADQMSRYYPDSGRIICAQFSAFMGIPFSWILLTVIPQSVSNWYAFATTLFFMGLTISWCATCANNPMFAEVVPSKHRTMIYAFDRAFEGSFSSFAAPAVGMLTEKIYGYDSKFVSLVNGSPQGAFALSRGLLIMMVIPFGLCCLFYSPLYFVFKHDRDNAKMASRKEQELIWLLPGHAFSKWLITTEQWTNLWNLFSEQPLSRYFVVSFVKEHKNHTFYCGYSSISCWLERSCIDI